MVLKEKWVLSWEPFRVIAHAGSFAPMTKTICITLSFFTFIPFYFFYFPCSFLCTYFVVILAIRSLTLHIRCRLATELAILPFKYVLLVTAKFLFDVLCIYTALWKDEKHLELKNKYHKRGNMLPEAFASWTHVSSMFSSFATRETLSL